MGKPMKSRISHMCLCLCALVLLIAGCGPKNLSDEEFAEAAQGICQTLADEYASASEAIVISDKYIGQAAAYRKAAEALAEINISEESAPQGSYLRTNLAELAEAQEIFADILTEALATADIEGQMFMFVTEGGKVFASGGSIFDIVELDIDPTIVLGMTETQTALREAATELDLPNCAPVVEEGD